MKDILIVYFEVKWRILEVINEVDSYFILVYKWNIEDFEMFFGDVNK